MKPVHTLRCALAPALLCLPLLGGCLPVPKPYDFRPKSGLNAAAQALPLRLEAIHTENRTNLTAPGFAPPCPYEDEAVCADSTARFFTLPLKEALHETFARTRLFSNSAARGVNLNAAFVGFEASAGKRNTSTVRIRYEFSDSVSGEVIRAEEIETGAQKFTLNPADLGQSYNEAVQQSIRANLRELVRRLHNPQQAAPLRGK